MSCQSYVLMKQYSASMAFNTLEVAFIAKYFALQPQMCVRVMAVISACRGLSGEIRQQQQGELGVWTMTNEPEESNWTLHALECNLLSIAERDIQLSDADLQSMENQVAAHFLSTATERVRL